MEKAKERLDVENTVKEAVENTAEEVEWLEMLR